METLRLGSTGPNVKLIQSLLIKLGYSPGQIDGVYGSQTQRAVIDFQRDNGLTPDGIVGERTWNVFLKFLRGYDIYTVRSGDTLYNIAGRYNTTLNTIITANPGINPNLIYPGQQIVVPYNIEVVFTDIDYTYEILERDIEGLKARYPFLETGSIGTSVLGKNLYYLKLGNGPNEVFYNSAHHSLEWITSPLVMKFAENFLKAYSEGGQIRGYDIADIWNRSSIYIVPMVNPDGVDLVLKGLDPSYPFYEQLLAWNTTGRPFSEVWNANIRGVDLNRNYPARWELGKAQEEELGVYGPGPTRYGGPYPLSEPETTAIAMLAFRSADLRGIVAYSSMAQMGLITMGVFAFDDLGLDGAVLQSVAHGADLGGDVPARRDGGAPVRHRHARLARRDGARGSRARHDRARRGDDRARRARIRDLRGRVPDHGRRLRAGLGILGRRRTRRRARRHVHPPRDLRDPARQAGTGRTGGSARPAGR